MTGLHLSQYRIDAELGRGGMGVVYRAYDTKLDRAVALKVLPAAALSSVDDRARFLREAKAAAQLSHPNVCHVYQVDEAMPLDADGNRVTGQDDARLFIAMEFIEGETLSERIADGPLKLTDAANIAGQVAEALKEAHAKQIVHRDIKSVNVMLTPAGVAKVLDFGLAKTAASTMLTRQGSTVGTIAYMSPEQARGEEVDGRTDLYSLGTMLYEMVAGRLPFGGDYEQAVLYGIMNEIPEPLTAVRTGVPMELERIVAKLLSKEAEYRYQTAGDLLADLKSLDLSGSGRSMPGTAVRAAPGTNRGTPRKTAPEWRLYAVAAAAFVVGAGVALLALRRDDAMLPTTRFPITLPYAATVLNPAWSPDGREIYYIGTDDETGASHVRVYSLSTGESGVVPNTEDAIYVNVSTDGRWLIFLVGGRNQYRKALLNGQAPSDIPGASTPFTGGQYGADGSFYFTDADFNIAAVDERGASRVVASPPDPAPDMFFWPTQSPDGSSLLWASWYSGTRSSGTYRLRAGETDFERVSTQYTLRALAANGYAFLIPTGDYGDPMAVGPFDPRTGQLLGDAVPFARIDYNAIAVSANGNLLYRELAADVGSTALEPLYRLEDNLEAIPVAVPPGPSNEFAIARRRNAVIFEVNADGGDRHDLYVLDLDTDVPTRLTREGYNRFPEWSPDDEYVYFRRIVDSSPGTIVRRRVDGSGPLETVLADTVAGGAAFSHPSISSDASLLLFTRMTESDWDLYRIRMDGPLPADQDDAVLVAGGEGDQGQADFSPDDRYVTFQSGGAIVVTTVDGGGEVEVSPDGRLPTWSPDGSWIYFQRGMREVHRVAVTTDPTFAITGSEEQVYRTPTHLHYDVQADGSALVTVGEGGELASEPRTWVVLNVFDQMERMAPRNR